ncbi:MAG: HD domain-containing protein [Patescibacteria group bacterium]
MPFLFERGSKEESRKAFFKRVSLFLSAEDPRYKEIEKAYDCAERALEGKFRDGGERSFSHSRATALILIACSRVRDYHLIIAGLLHDIVEDCPEWTVELVEQKFGAYVAMLIGYLTRPPRWKFVSREVYGRAYHLQFRFAPRDFFLIKLADRLHNMTTLGPCSHAKQIRQIEETRKYYLPYAKKYRILVREIEEALDQAEANLKQ